MQNGKRISGIILILLGSLLLLLAVTFAASFLGVGSFLGAERDKYNADWESFSKNAVEVSGEIMDTDGGTTILYPVDDDYYCVTLSVSNSAYGIGDVISVYYDPADPEQCMVPELYDSTYGLLDTIFSGLGAGLGAAFGILGLGILIGGIFLMKKSRPAV